MKKHIFFCISILSVRKKSKKHGIIKIATISKNDFFVSLICSFTAAYQKYSIWTLISENSKKKKKAQLCESQDLDNSLSSDVMRDI